MKVIKSILAVALLAAFFTTPCFSRDTLTNGLIAYYPFNGDAIDGTGNGHDGVVVNATLIADRFGNPASAYGFDGATTMIVVTNSSDLQPFGDFTVSVWAWVPQVPDSFSMIFCKHKDWGNDSGWIMDVMPPSGGLPLQFQSAPYFDIYSPQTTIPFGQWFQAVFTYKRESGVCSFYINGKLTDRRKRSYNTTPDSNPFIMGAQPTWQTESGYNYFFSGGLDDVRIYNRALSGSDVASLFKKERVPKR